MGKLRIIAGELRGRRLEVRARAALRPTSDRVREALFSALHGRLESARVLDLYAGTGALGFEALSRGAAHVLFVEAGRYLCSAIASNADRFGVRSRVEVWRRRVESIGPRPSEVERRDLVLADPPYSDRNAPDVLSALSDGGWLAEGAVIVFEREASQAEGLPPRLHPSFRVVRTRRYGRTSLDFWEVADSEPPPTNVG